MDTLIRHRDPAETGEQGLHNRILELRAFYLPTSLGHALAAGDPRCADHADAEGHPCDWDDLPTLEHEWSLRRAGVAA
jgi:hypothetical protein